MSEQWGDHDFLAYVEEHAKTEVALFSPAHVKRLHALAGSPITGPGVWASMSSEYVEPLLKAAREQLALDVARAMHEAARWAYRDANGKLTLLVPVAEIDEMTLPQCRAVLRLCDELDREHPQHAGSAARLAIVNGVSARLARLGGE